MRRILHSPAIAAVALLMTSCMPAVRPELAVLEPQLRSIEIASGGRLGVALADAKGRVIGSYRGAERFAFCSTFKLLLAGMVLDGYRNGRWSLDESLPVAQADIVFHSPVATAHVGRGSMTIGAAAQATVQMGDNAAANLLIRRTGGVEAFNRWLRELGDPATRLDRLETGLNENRAGDVRDTTTPEAIARSAAKLLFGTALASAEQQMLRSWMVESETGLKRIRAGLPAGYVVGDKTGTCGAKGRESYNDVAFVLPDPGADSRGYILAVYLNRPTGSADDANAAIAQVARSAVVAIGSRSARFNR